MDAELEPPAAVAAAIDRLLAEHPPAATTPPAFWGAQYDAGLAWVEFPPGRGGQGGDPGWRRAVEDRLAAAGASFDNVRANPMGHGLATITILRHGTDEQRERLLRPLFVSEDIWCQLFSEPGAGSDLAGLATSATRHGTDWIVDGQKVWSSFARDARRGLLLARTDPDEPRHRGITAFVLDMTTPGVEVRPLREMTGEAHFNEVFLTSVRVPDTDRLGGVGDGWRVARTTLMAERVLLGDRVPARGSGPIADAVRVWRERGHDDVARRDQLTRLWVEAECLRLTNLRAAAVAEENEPGPEGSIGKLHAAELNQRIYELCLALAGAHGMLEIAGRGGHTYLESDGALTWAFLRSRANTIEGGTSEVMRNIIAERVLGLPREGRPPGGLTGSDTVPS